MSYKWEKQETSGSLRPRYLNEDGIHGVIYYNADECHWDLVLWVPKDHVAYADGFRHPNEAERWAAGFIKRNLDAA